MDQAEQVIWLRQFRDSIVVPLSATDPEKWPIRSGRVMGLVADALATEFFADVHKLLERGWSTAEIAGLFGNPSRLWRFTHHLLQGLRAAGASHDAQREAMLLVLDLVSELKAGSPFLSNGANIVLAPDAAALVDTQLTNQAIDDLPARSRATHRAAAALWSYAETLYFVAHEIGVEVHGPYPSSDGSVFLIRDYFQAAPTELWPEVYGFLNFDSLRIAVRYRDFIGHMDVYNNLYLGPGISLPTHATSVLAWRDGIALDGQELEEISQSAAGVISQVTRRVDSWDLVEVARKYVEVFWWRKRELALMARDDWRPSQDVLDRITAEAIPPASSRNPSIDDLRTSFDLTGG